MFNLSCRHNYALILGEQRFVFQDAPEAPNAPTENVLTAEEQENLDKGADSLYVQTPDTAEKFIRDNAQDAIAIIGRELAVRDTFLRELEANDTFMAKVQLMIGALTAEKLNELRTIDPRDATQVLPILKATADQLQVLIGTEQAVGVVTSRGDTGWIERGIGIGAGALIVSGGVALGALDAAGTAAVAGLGVAAGAGSTSILLNPYTLGGLAIGGGVAATVSGLSSWYRKDQIDVNDDVKNFALPDMLGPCIPLLENPDIPWDTSSYEVSGSQEDAGEFFERHVVSINGVDRANAKPKIALTTALMEIMGSAPVQQHIADHPMDDRISDTLQKWVAQHPDSVTLQDVEVVKAQLFGVRNDIETDYRVRIEKAADKLAGLKDGIAALQEKFPDFNPALTPDDTTLMQQPVLTLGDVAKAEALELRVRELAQEFLVDKVNEAKTQFAPDSEAFHDAQKILDSELHGITDLSKDDVGFRLLLAADHIKDTYAKYEMEKALKEQKDAVATLSAALAAIEPKTAELETRKTALEEEIARLKISLEGQTSVSEELRKSFEKAQQELLALRGDAASATTTSSTTDSHPDHGAIDEGGDDDHDDASEDGHETVDVANGELHEISTNFFRELLEMTDGKKFLQKVFYNMGNQDYTLIEQFAGDLNPDLKPKEIKERFKAANLDRIGIFIEPKERIASYRFACLVVRAVRSLKQVNVPCKDVLPDSGTRGWDTISGTTGRVVDQLKVFLEPHLTV